MLLAIVNARVVPVEGDEFEGTVLVRDGRIAELGADVEVPEGATVLDVEGAQVTPGLVDAHVHLGVHPEGDGPGASDTNEMTNPNTAGVRTIDAIDPFDEGFDLATAFAGADAGTRRPVDLVGLLEIMHRGGLTETDDVSIVEAVRPDGTTRRFAFGAVRAENFTETDADD